MGKVIGLISIKGGVGKTTLSSALATSLANNFGKKVLLIDANYSAPNLGLHMDIISPKGTIHEVLDGAPIKSAIHRQYHVDIIPGSFGHNKEINPMKLKDRLIQAKREYDFIVLDSSPSLNEEILSTMVASDHLFLVSTPDYPTLSCSMKAAKLAKQRNRPIEGVIINKISEPLYEITLEEIQESTGIPVVGRVWQDKRVKRALHFRVPPNLYAKRSDFAKEINRISAAITGEKESRFSKLFLAPTKERVNREVMRKSLYEGVFR